MPENIQFNPPQINIFQGKSPPTSWFKENVVRFSQITSDHDFLEEILNFAKQLQQAKLLETFPLLKAVHPEMKFVPIPEKGKMEEVANGATFNSSQFFVKTVMESMAKLLAQLKQMDPSLAKELEPLLKTLGEMAKNFPNLSQQQLKMLSEIMKKMTEDFAAKLPMGARKKFWSEVLDMHKSLMNENSEMMKDLGNKSRQLQETSKTIQDLKNNLNTLGKAIQEHETLPSNSLPLLATISEGLANLIPQSSPEVKKKLENLLKSLEALKGKKLDEKAKKAVAEAIQKGSILLEDISQVHVQQSLGYQKSVDSLEGMQKHFGKSAVGAVGQSIASGSLPDDFANGILNHYMPNQEKYLLALAELLMFANMGASIGNSLMSIITDFNSASNNFAFSNSLHDGTDPGTFSGNATDAQNRLNEEKANAAQDAQELKDLIGKIDQKIQDINNNKNLTPTQKADLIKSLQGFKANAQTSLSQVTTLQGTLSQLTIVPVVTKAGAGPEFKVNYSGTSKDWRGDLSTEENTVINGAPGQVPPGGLVHISQIINSFQRGYSDQSQNQQMMLQMRMTEIQQEWTVVSTSLQLLNQMYMSVAQAIYK